MESLQLSFGLLSGLGDDSREVCSLSEEWTVACTRARSTGPLSPLRPIGRSVFKGLCFSKCHQYETQIVFWLLCVQRLTFPISCLHLQHYQNGYQYCTVGITQVGTCPLKMASPCGSLETFFSESTTPSTTAPTTVSALLSLSKCHQCNNLTIILIR